MGESRGSIDRRTVLAALAASAAVPSLAGCAATPPPANRIAGPVIGQQVDAHCHIFNVLDVPSLAFVLDIALANEKLPPIALSLTRFIVGMVEDFAPDAATERAALRQMLAGGPAPARNSDDVAKLIDAGVRKFIARHASPDLTLHAGDTAQQRADKKFLTDELYARFLGTPRSDAAASVPSASALTDLAPTLADKMVHDTSFDETTAYIRQFIIGWAPKLADYRYQLAEDLGTLFEGSAPQKQFLTPATLDITNWLDNPGTPTPLDQQVELMSLISQVQPPTRAVHALVGFDPVRQIDDLAHGRPTALDLVKIAVEEKGLIGVKVYPPMGFRATANFKLGDTDFPPALVARFPGLGPRLDAALDQLYTYCAGAGVPIMAHCAATQAPTQAAACRADPQYWDLVLTKYPTLKVNLAHFGGIWAFYGKPEPTKCGTGDWTRRIAEMMTRHTGLHADVGDFANVLMRPWDEHTAEIIEQLRSLIAQYPVVAERLMYGTDWQLLDREPGNAGYYDAMRKQIVGALGVGNLDRFYWRNAVTLFGLSPGQPGHARLTRFYAKTGRSTALLDRFSLR